jgi:hypothetical protein
MAPIGGEPTKLFSDFAKILEFYVEFPDFKIVKLEGNEREWKNWR